MIKEDTRIIQKAMYRRLLNDMNVNFNKWSSVADFSEITVEAIEQLYRCMAQVLDKSLVDAIVISVDASAREWRTYPKEGAKIEDPTAFHLISTVMINLLDRIGSQNLEKATALMDIEINEFMKSEPNRHTFSKLHETYSTAINDLLYELVDVKYYSVKILLTSHGMSRMKTTSDHISLTSTSHRGYKVDMVTGDISLNISINGQGGWHLLTKQDYIDIVVLVQDPIQGHDLGYISILDVVLKPLSVQQSVSTSYDESSNVVAFKRK